MVMPGTILDMEEVTTDLIDFHRGSRIRTQDYGYDPYNAAVFLETWEDVQRSVWNREGPTLGVKTERSRFGS